MRKFWTAAALPDANPESPCVEWSDSWEEWCSSPDGDADDVLTFEMDPDHENRNLLGRVRGSFSENSGVIEFQLHGQRSEAFFCDRDVYVNGKLVDNLWSNLQLGSEVYLDILEDQAGRLDCYVGTRSNQTAFL